MRAFFSYAWRIVGRLLLIPTLVAALMLWFALFIPLGDDAPDFPSLTIRAFERVFGI